MVRGLFTSTTKTSLLLIATLARTSSAGDFLGAAAADASLEAELGIRGQGRIRAFEQALAPSFKALPKNEAGNLQHQTARYILHRFFVQRHGWYIKGLEPNGDTFHTGSSPDSLKDWVPSYLLGKLEKRVQHKGLSSNDLAVLAAAIDDLAAEEASTLVRNIFSEMQMVAAKSVEPAVEDAVLVYIASFLSNEFWDAETSVRSKNRFVSEYHGWNRTREWYKAIEQSHLPATADAPSVDVTTQIAVDIGGQYGTFNDQMCSEIKGALLGMWTKGNSTGRVRLVDFYKMGLDTQWDLVEKQGYLQALGAIDDSNASSPMVIIPNYLTARPNCLMATNLYAVCCRNECEDLLGHLERSIGAPEADPERIMELISPLGTDTVQVPRAEAQLAQLEGRLRELAEEHGGKVKLHGRLFAQWMHHAYPSECPYPHEAGAASPSSPDQWLLDGIEASEEERRQMVEESCSPEEAAAGWTGDLPWSHQEELLYDAAPPEVVARSGAAGKHARALALSAVCFAAAGVAVALSARLEARDKLRAKLENLSRMQVLFATLALVCVALNVVNIVLLLVMVCVGLLFPRLVAMGAYQKKHVEKNVV